MDKKVGHNATSKMMQLFKKAVTRARNAGLIQFNPFTQPITFVQVDKGFLTMDELQSIMDKEIEVERLQRVRDVFVFSCWTGLAYIDVYLLKDEHIQKYLDGNYWIISKRHKTGGAHQRAPVWTFPCASCKSTRVNSPTTVPCPCRAIRR